MVKGLQNFWSFGFGIQKQELAVLLTANKKANTPPENLVTWSIIEFMSQVNNEKKEQLVLEAFDYFWQMRDQFIPTSSHFRYYNSMLDRLRDKWAEENISMVKRIRNQHGLTYSKEREEYNKRYLLFLLKNSKDSNSSINSIFPTSITKSEATILYDALVEAKERQGDVPDWKVQFLQKNINKLVGMYPSLKSSDNSDFLKVTEFWNPYAKDSQPLTLGWAGALRGISWSENHLWTVVYHRHRFKPAISYLLKINLSTLTNEAIKLPKELNSVNMKISGIFSNRHKVFIVHGNHKNSGISVYNTKTRNWTHDTGYNPHANGYKYSAFANDKIIVPIEMSVNPRVYGILEVDCNTMNKTMLVSGRRTPRKSPLDLPGSFFNVFHSSDDGDVYILPKGGGSAQPHIYNLNSKQWQSMAWSVAATGSQKYWTKPLDSSVIKSLPRKANYIISPKERIKFAQQRGNQSAKLIIQTAEAPEPVIIPLQFKLSDKDAAQIIVRQYENEVSIKTKQKISSYFAQGCSGESLTTPQGVVIAPNNSKATGFWFIPSADIIKAYNQFKEKPALGIKKQVQSQSLSSRTPQGQSSHETYVNKKRNIKTYKTNNVMMYMSSLKFEILGILLILLTGLQLVLYKRKKNRGSKGNIIGLIIIGCFMLPTQSPASEVTPLDRQLLSAVVADDISALKKALSTGADPNCIDPDRRGETALVIATDTDNYELIKLLLDSGADVNKRTVEYNNTALINAAYLCSPKILTLLIDRGAAISVWNKTGWTTFNGVMWKQRFDNARVLLKALGVDTKGLSHEALVDEIVKATIKIKQGYVKEIQKKYSELAQ